MDPKRPSPETARAAARFFAGSCVPVEFPRRTDAHDRVLGTELSGAIARARIYDGVPEGTEGDQLAELVFNGGSVAGPGFGAFNGGGVTPRAGGGAPDGGGQTTPGGT